MKHYLFRLRSTKHNREGDLIIILQEKFCMWFNKSIVYFCLYTAVGLLTFKIKILKLIYNSRQCFVDLKQFSYMFDCY